MTAAAIAVTEAARYDGQTNRGSRSAGQKKELARGIISSLIGCIKNRGLCLGGPDEHHIKVGI